MSSGRDPFDEIEEFLERMSGQLGGTSGSWQSDGPLGQLTSGAESTAVDLVEHDGEFVATVDLPGFESDDVDVSLAGSTLVVDAERESSVDDEEEGQYLRRERRSQSVRRSVRLPEPVAKDEASARMNNGVLTVTLPKAELETSRSIEIDEE